MRKNIIKLIIEITVERFSTIPQKDLKIAIFYKYNIVIIVGNTIHYKLRHTQMNLTRKNISKFTEKKKRRKCFKELIEI